MRKLALVFTLIGVFFSLNVKDVLAVGAARIGTAEVYQERGGKHCNFFNSCVQNEEDLHLKLSDIAYKDGKPAEEGSSVQIYLYPTEASCGNPSYGGAPGYIKSVNIENGEIQTTISGANIKSNCSYKLTIVITKKTNIFYSDKKEYPASPMAVLQCDNSAEQCNTSTSIVANYDLCKQQIKEGTDQFNACQDCFSNNGIWTAVGCIPSNPESVITTVISIGLAAGGGIVLIMILVGSFMLSVSQGDPNKTKETKEIITSAIIGLLFVIFSVTILQFIGVSILRIPGFGQ